MTKPEISAERAREAARLIIEATYWESDEHAATLLTYIDQSEARIAELEGIIRGKTFPSEPECETCAALAQLAEVWHMDGPDHPEEDVVEYIRADLSAPEETEPSVTAPERVYEEIAPNIFKDVTVPSAPEGDVGEALEALDQAINMAIGCSCGGGSVKDGEDLAGTLTLIRRALLASQAREPDGRIRVYRNHGSEQWFYDSGQCKGNHEKGEAVFYVVAPEPTTEEG